MKHTDTQEIPALDAWKKFQKNRNDSVENAYKSIRKSIDRAVSECKSSATFDRHYFQCEYDMVGYWFWRRRAVPIGTTKQLFERLESDGFTVKLWFDEMHPNFTVSWDFSE